MTTPIWKRVYQHWITKMIIQIIAIGVLIQVLGAANGILGYVGFVVVWSGFIYWRQRKAFNEMWLNLIRMIEIYIWGKPQEKEYWENEKRKTKHEQIHKNYRVQKNKKINKQKVDKSLD